VTAPPEHAATEASEPTDDLGDEQTPAGSVWAQFAFGAAILAVGILVLAQGLQVPGGMDPAGPRFLPVLVGVGWVLLAAAYLAGTLVTIVKRARPVAAERFDHIPRVAALLVLLVAYAFALDPIGYLLATSLFFTVAAAILGSRKHLRDAVVGIGLTVVVYFLFSRTLGIYLPAGVLPL
jgi:putative tricarboxylic transport membrane protein